MSEYQYYEFQTIDRPLTRDEQADISQLSSRVQLSSTRAIFTYQYGDFRGDARKVLARYFDAMLYLANWGSKQLMFRFPQSLIDLQQMQPYCVEDVISFSTTGEHVILNIRFDDEGSGFWADSEGVLDSLVELRGDILQGDYRALYLAWLKATQFEQTEEEPPVPLGLSVLSPALRDLARLFEIDEHLMQVAAQASGPLEISPDLLSQAPRPELKPRRKARQLLEAADQERKAEAKRRSEEAEARRIAELESLFQRQAQTWQVVEELIRKSNSSAYEQAAELLAKLRQATALKGKETDFETHLGELRERYKTRHALMARLREARL